MKNKVLMLSILFLNSCCTKQEFKNTPISCTARILAPVGSAIGLGILAKSKYNENLDKEFLTKKPSWLYESDSSKRGVLIAPNCTLISTHVWNTTRNFNIEYEGKFYKTKKVIKLNFDEANSSGWFNKTDLSLVFHDIITGVKPVIIADKIKEGDKVRGYLRERFTKGQINKVSKYIEFSFKVIPGDSSSPVLNDTNELVTLVSTDAKTGPNLSLVKFKIENVINLN